mgnify:CR=1 FL=1
MFRSTTALTVGLVLVGLAIGLTDFGPNPEDEGLSKEMIFFLLLQTAMLGTFCAQDLVLFYVFWEAVLLLMALMIGIWGGQRRIYASVKFVLYTMVGSVLMLAAVLYLYAKAGSFSIATENCLRLAA